MKESLPVLAVLFAAGDSWTPAIVLTLAILLAVLVACALVALYPVLILRPLLGLLTHTFYRVTVYGRENVPDKGGALLVCNHVSYIDWLLLLAAHKRYIRFVIWAPFARMWGIRQLLRWGRVIPIDSSAGPKTIIKALHSAADAVAAGELVCIFAEGGLTRTGFLLAFHRGFEQILKRTPAPIIPVCLDHVWGSIFSYQGGKLLWKWPQELPYPVSVSFGPSMPPTSSAAEVRLAI